MLPSLLSITQLAHMQHRLVDAADGKHDNASAWYNYLIDDTYICKSSRKADNLLLRMYD